MDKPKNVLVFGPSNMIFLYLSQPQPIYKLMRQAYKNGRTNEWTQSQNINSTGIISNFEIYFELWFFSCLIGLRL